MIRSLLTIAFSVAAFLSASGLQNRWFYCSRNFTQDVHVDDFRRVAETAAANGFNGVQLACGLEGWRNWNAKRKARFEKVKEICRENKLEIIPGLWSAGYGSFLQADQNACAALPYAGIWVSEGSKAVWKGNPVEFPNGGFDKVKASGAPEYWAWTDGIGKFAFVDPDVKCEGVSSLRFECSSEKASKHRHFRTSRNVKVKPHSLYRVSCRVKTEGFEPASSFQMMICGGKESDSHSRRGVESTQDWKKIAFTFNSGNDTEKRFYVGSWGGKAGKLWIDDVEFEEVGPIAAVRREGCPVRVTNADTGVVYSEGKDYMPLEGVKSVWREPGVHPPLSIAVCGGGAIKPGDRLAVSIYVPATVANNQHPVCMSWRGLDAYMAQSAADIKAVLNPKSWFLAMDEIRAGGTCELCVSRNTDMAHILGDFVERECAAIKKVRPDADIYIWADMFYPKQNAHDNYYSCRGTFEGSWKLVPKDIIMCCWSQSQRAEQLKFFSDLGFRTFGGAYYDVDTLDSTYDWNRLCRQTPGCMGVMYTTWRNKYELLAPFGRIVTRNLQNGDEMKSRPPEGEVLIEREVEAACRETDALQSKLSDACSLADYRSLVRCVNGTNMWTAALQKALDEHEIVRIPPAAEKYFFDGTVIVPSNRRIEAAGAVIRIADGMRTVLLRNASAVDGTLAPVPASAPRDSNIAIVGGRWEDWCTKRGGYGRTGMYNLLPREKGNFYGVSTMFYFGTARHVSVTGATFHRCGGFAVQAGDADALAFRDITFDRCFADGLHLNGNLTRVLARNVRGQVGDDLVALNAYDWLNSSVNFGPQKYILCEDLELIHKPGVRVYPAIRILPAKFRYADGSVVDCAISDIVFRRVKGITTYKMYLQTPRYAIGNKPEWGEVGSGGNLFFSDLEIDLNAPIDRIGQYMTQEPPRGHFAAFEFGANLSLVHFRNVDITFHADRWPLTHLAQVGPKSCLLPGKNGNPPYEVFDPYVSCRVGKVVLENIRVHGKAPKELIHVSSFDDINKDGRSTGRGIIETIEKENLFYD